LGSVLFNAFPEWWASFGEARAQQVREVFVGIKLRLKPRTVKVFSPFDHAKNQAAER